MPFRKRTAGYTLIELLVVIMIAVLLMVLALPAAKMVMENGRPREASRVLNTTIVAAKANAAGSGRAVGVELVTQRIGDPMSGALQCTQIYMCEVPPLYAGDLADARAVVDVSATPWKVTFPNNGAANLPTLLDNSKLFEIRFNHRGPWYNARLNSMSSEYEVAPLQIYPATTNTNGYTFQIRRQPVRVGNPVELPKSTAIDMTYSGVGQLGREFNNVLALRVMFAPNGNVESIVTVTPAAMSGDPPTVAPLQSYGTIHFLVGATNKISPQQDMAGWNINQFDKSNLADGNALWVSISRTSGVVTTNENTPDPSAITDATNMTQRDNYLRTCRQYAIQRTQKGGL